MAAPAKRPCAPWDISNYACPGLPSSVDQDTIDRAQMSATEILYALSARQYGVCSEVGIRPVLQNPLFWSYGERRLLEQQWSSGLIPRMWWMYDPISGFACQSTKSIRLWHSPIISIDEVKVDGEILPADEYRVDEWSSLRRTDPTDATLEWPTVQNLDLADTEPGTWSVSYTWGNQPPEIGLLACATLACELIKLEASPSSCNLPQRVTSMTRGGVTYAMLDPADFLEKGRTGILIVDQFLQIANPNKSKRKPGIYRADAVRGTVGRRLGT